MIPIKQLSLALEKSEALCSSLEKRYTLAKVGSENGPIRKVTPPVEVVKLAEKPVQPSANGLSKSGGNKSKKPD